MVSRDYNWEQEIIDDVFYRHFQQFFSYTKLNGGWKLLQLKLTGQRTTLAMGRCFFYILFTKLNDGWTLVQLKSQPEKSTDMTNSITQRCIKINCYWKNLSFE